MNLRALFGKAPNTGINEYYVTTKPNPQAAVDILKGAWSSAFPEPFNNIQAGMVPLFTDQRIKWFANEVGGVEGKTVLELGPLEGGHTYMLEKMGAKDVTAVEANTKAYLKCLISKEIMGMTKARFLCGDFLEYMRAADCPKFDLSIACGVLYHMKNPAEMLSLVCDHTKDHIFIWTHYYNEKIVRERKLQKQFTGSTQSEFNGFKHILYRQEYGVALKFAGFCGGSAPFSQWMSREDILRCLEHFGFSKIKINFDEPDHQNGSAWALTASRS